MSNWDASLDMLKDELSYLYMRDSDYRAFVREVGMREENIRFIGKATTDWSNILEEAHKKRIIVNIIAKALSEHPGRFLLQVVERYVKHNGGSRMKTWPISLSEGAREVFELHNRIQQIMQILICWNDTLVTIRKTIPDFSISPEDYICIRQLMSQLEMSLQKMYQLFTNSDTARSVFGTEYYGFITNLDVTQQQTNEIITKIQEFQDNYSNSSIVSFELEEYIQQELAEIVQNLYEAEGSMSVWQHQFPEGAISPDKVSNDIEKVSSSLEVPSDPMNIARQLGSHQIDKAPISKIPVTEPISNPVIIDPEHVTRDLLERALCLFYDTDSGGFTTLCSSLASKFDDTKVRKRNLRGNKLEEKITYLFDYSIDKGFYNDLVQYIVSNVPGFQKKLSEVWSSQKK